MAKRKRAEHVDRYICQREGSFDCGPVSLYNLGVWAGVDVPYDSLHERCCPDDDYGTYHDKFLYAFDLVEEVCSKRKKYVLIKTVREPDIDELKKHLAKGGSFILLYHWERRCVKNVNKRVCDCDYCDEGAHYVFVDSYSDLKFRVINSYVPWRAERSGSEGVVSYVGIRDFKKLLKPYESRSLRSLCCSDYSFPTACLFSIYR